jgi:hypothetical protein
MRMENLMTLWCIQIADTKLYIYIYIYIYIFRGRRTWEAIMTQIRDPLKLRNLKVLNFIYLCLNLLRIYYNSLYRKTRKL